MAKRMTTRRFVNTSLSNRVLYCTLQEALVCVMALLPCSPGYRIASDRSSGCRKEILPAEFSGSARVFTGKCERQTHFSGSGTQILTMEFSHFRNLFP